MFSWFWEFFNLPHPYTFNGNFVDAIICSSIYFPSIYNTQYTLSFNLLGWLIYDFVQFKLSK